MIDNLSSQKTDLNSLANKKGITNVSLNHLKNLEATMLDEVFCYAPTLGRNVYFIIPTIRLQNFGFINISSSDLISGGGGGDSNELFLAQISGKATFVNNELSTPCLSNVLETLLHNNDLLNEMTYMLQQFNLCRTIHLTFYEKPLSQNNRYGEFVKTSKENVYKIYLDNNELPKFSKEKIMSIIFHEVIHAHLTEMFNNRGSDWEHEQMTKNYLFTAVNSLVKFYPNCKDYANDIILSGLTETNYFKRIPISDQNVILFKANQYKNHTYGDYCK
ncbi:hypothetical protein EOJ36_02770 [Sandaracinomonas limnophila]|uniref:SprT-like domain-containing protein n=1 Tax=Sandaracinomonas limnophila TaxID=1862386 RepID=A0A437PXK0_9BACT|nr:hypothetical protein [Sandaracinomonas limnophila]RVU26938.1 hypothetical protein EOJ36_02770 [Sandaracinomonas limnophila]